MNPRITLVPHQLDGKIRSLIVREEFSALLRSMELRAELLKQEAIDGITAMPQSLLAGGQKAYPTSSHDKIFEAGLILSAVASIKAELKAESFIQNLS